MQRGYIKGKILRQSMVEAELPRETPVPLRRKRKSRRLAPEEIVDVVYRILVKHEHQKDLAKEYYVLPSTVCRLVSKTRKAPGMLQELLI